MTQEDKELLLKDLCGRLPYGVKAEVTNTQGYHHDNIAKKGEKTIDTLKGFDSSYDCFTVYHNNPLDWGWTCSEIDIEDIKPYLFPLSSITEEQAIELFNIFGISLVDSVEENYIKVNEITGITFFFQNGFDVETHLDKLIDWLNKNHFDYRGLIEKGLAIDATGLNIY